MANKKFKTALLIGLMIFVLSGCTLRYGDGLLALPKLPGDFVQLQKKLDAELASGSSYAAALTGSNRQAVQLVDVNADGGDEALAFFQNPSEGFYVCVYAQVGEGFEEIGRAEGYGTAIRAVNYPVIDASGRMALAVSWSLDETSDYGMTVFSIAEGGITPMLDVQYNNLIIQDINFNGTDEICLAVRNTDGYSMKTYALAGNEYHMQSEALLCHEVKAVAKMTAGYSADGIRAIYLDSTSINGGYVTDIVTIKGSMANNVTIDHASGSGALTMRAINIFSSDVDGDGILDVPTTRTDDKGVELAGQRNRLVWKNFLEGGQASEVAMTYHSLSEEWYILWPEKWDEKVQSAKKTVAGVSKTEFFINYALQGENSIAYILTIYVYSGENAERYAMSDGSTVLAKSGNVVYAYKLYDETSGEYQLSAEEVARGFRTIEKEWPTGGFSQ